MHAFSILAAGLGGLLLAMPAPAFAGSASGTLEVSFRVLPNCSVSTSPLSFAAAVGSAAEAEAAIDVRCSAETGVEVSLDGGRHPAGAQRRMTSQSDAAVPYTVYLDPARSQVWGRAPVAGEVGPDRELRLVAYGRIELGTSALPVGEYRDSVVVTVAF